VYRKTGKIPAVFEETIFCGYLFRIKRSFLISEVQWGVFMIFAPLLLLATFLYTYPNLSYVMDNANS